MLGTAGITAVHVKKLGHTIDEIRLRALDNVISKYDLGFACDCDAVRKEIIQKLFNWFSFETAPQPEKALNFLLRLLKVDAKSYLNAFGKLKFQNELYELRRKLSSEWYAKLDEIEEAVLHLERNRDATVWSESDKCRIQTQDRVRYTNNNCEREDYNDENDIFNLPSILDNTTPFDVTLEHENGTRVSKTVEGGIKWLVMPWQPLVTSDRGVLTAVEEALHNAVDINHILHTCQFITNVMMQDFPAEVFLQRPAIITILHGLLKSSTNMSETHVACIVPTVLKTLRKLTRSLRFRIYYYCEPCVANKKQKLLGGKLDSNVYTSSEGGDGPDSGVPEANYQAYQSAGTSDRSQSVSENVDDSVLQLQQMLLPVYCIESLKHVLTQLSIPIDSIFPLRNIKYVTDLTHELVQLLTICVMPNIWLCNDGMATKINDDLKALLNLMGEVMEYFGSCSNVDYLRITYLYLTTIITRLLSSIVPLELADAVIPNALKASITSAVMDAPIYLLYPALHSILLEYARQFQGANQTALIKLFDETRAVAKSMQSAICVLKNLSEQSPSETLRMLHASKLSLSYHKNLTVVKMAVKFLQDNPRYSFNDEDRALATKLTLNLLANADVDVRYTTYVECYTLVKNILGVEYNKLSWENLTFLLEPSVLTEIISYGATSEDSRINEMSRDILVFILKGKIQMGETGWLRALEALVPVLYLLQCHADTHTPLGQCITKMFDPDISNNIQLPFLEVIKGNLRFLYSPDSDIREEALCRLIWLLGKEKDSVQKLPRLSSLHGLPLSSLCIFERKNFVKRSEGNYQRSNMLSVLEMLTEPNVDPKIRKSALVQISVMLSDTSLHKLFINQGGLPLILDIFNKALVEKDYVNYPDSVIPIISILKLLAFFECTIRHELSLSSNVLFSIVRSLFLFPNNECIKSDGAQLLCLLLYSEYIIRVNEKDVENNIASHISLPYIVTNMKLPFVCRSHWKTSIHRRSDISLIHGSNPIVLTFIRQYWTWESNGGVNVLWKCLNDLKDSEIAQKLIILEKDLLSLQCSFPQYCCQQQLYNIQNSTMHYNVICALDYLTMYLKFYKVLQRNDEKDIESLPWEQTFERFLLSHPTSKEDCDLFVDVLIFLQLYLNIAKKGKCSWISRIMKNMTRLLADLFKNLEVDNQNVHQSILKLVRTCSAIEKMQKSNDEPKNTWIRFVEFVVSTLCFGDQQHFYNLAYLDWLLTCLTYLIGQCEWGKHKNLLLSLCNTLIEPIVSFHGAGTVSFMGLSITRNSIICLNHLLHQMQINFNKSSWIVFWCEEDRSLNWLPMLWQNRDPLVRASALQLLAGLMNTVHTASQLFNAIAMAPSDLCHTLLQCITSGDESCLVREQACIAFCNMLKNCNFMTVQCDDSLQPQAVLMHVEQCNIYHEISVLCSNIYTSTTLDAEQSESQGNDSKATIVQSLQSSCISLVPRTVSHLYNCQDELQLFSGRVSEITDVDNPLQSIATPSLITAACNLLNNLIFIGQHEVVRQVYEYSIDKYLFGCLTEIPKDIRSRKSLSHYSDTLEMYISICTVLTNCIAHSNEYAAVVLFSADSLYILFCFLNIDLYQSTESRLIYLRNRLWTEIYNFVAVLTLTEDQHFEAIQSALELCGPETVMASVCFAIKDSMTDLRMSAISFLAFLLSHEIQRDSLGRSDTSLLQTVLDTNVAHVSIESKDGSLRDVISNVNKLSIRNANVHSRKSNESERDLLTKDDQLPNQGQTTIGGELCGLLLHLFIAHSYAKSKKSSKQSQDKDLIVGALANLLCVSKKAKQTALRGSLPETALMILKELYVKLNLQPFELYKKQAEKKTHPLLHDVNCTFILLINFMYGDVRVKESLTKKGLADVVHKLWAWIALNKTVSTTALKLLATFTTKCNAAAQSLTLTTILPGSGLRKTPNTLALIHVVIQVTCKEIERAGQIFDNHKMHFAFHILRNAVHVHECRVCISKSNLLQLFTKIHPTITKRIKPWPLVEIYCLEFLIDFTYYEEGQLCVPKATDALDVLMHLAKCSSSSSKVLAISILRNLAFNVTNRPRLLSSVDFINLLHDVFKNGSPCEINLVGSMLWSLISNNQKGKLIARSAGFSQSIREALGRFTLSSIDASKQERELVRVLQYVLTILSPVEVKNSGVQPS
ncbi:PREDICTED: rotatin isoform X2 [Vollenhovia emeryi]|uniref:rotatin isoform X2 n=1 Tax=Vollenhovia emeryi TaxID=411798 RepID=UPI0005F41FB0|nr:PREDICTED: rotatin isoform X2 [Vollenhovia emeryi]